MAYCTVNDVRLLTSLSVDDIDDEDLKDIIAYATAELNRDINYLVRNEEVKYISAEKENDIDGSNTTFYLKDVHDNHLHLGDYDDDGDVDTDDMEFYTLDNSVPAVRTTYSVSSLDDTEIGKVTLSSSPTSDETLYVTYSVAPLDESGPDQLIKQACVQLTAALAYTKIKASKIGKFKIGKISVTQQGRDTPFAVFYDMYKNTVFKINARMAAFEEKD